MIRVKIRVLDDDSIPSENKSYPGGARDALSRMGATNFSIGYADFMPIYCDVSDELYRELSGAAWIHSIEIVDDGAC